MFEKWLYVLSLSVCLLACGESRKNLKIRENTNKEAQYSISTLQVLQSALEEAPEDTDILYKIARWYYHAKDYQKAREYLEKAMKVQPDWKIYLLDAQCHYSNKKYEQTKSSWREAYRLEPSALPILLFGLQWTVERQDSLIATKLIEKIEKAYPQEPQLYFWKGKWASTRKDTTQAFAQFQKALSFNPYLSEAYLHITSLYNFYEKPKKALESARKGLTIRPNYDSLLQEMAIAYQNLKEPDSAQKYYLKAYQSNKTLYRASYELGIYSWKQAKYQEALTFFENSYQYKQDMPKINYYIGNCLELLDKKTQALNFYKKAVQQEPDNLLIRQALFSLQQKMELERLQRTQDSLRKAQQEAEMRRMEEMQKQNQSAN
jgi:tetratricopeptide (TPR) repeat protein